VAIYFRAASTFVRSHAILVFAELVRFLCCQLATAERSSEKSHATDGTTPRSLTTMDSSPFLRTRIRGLKDPSVAVSCAKESLTADTIIAKSPATRKTKLRLTAPFLPMSSSTVPAARLRWHPYQQSRDNRAKIRYHTARSLATRFFLAVTRAKRGATRARVVSAPRSSM